MDEDATWREARGKKKLPRSGLVQLSIRQLEAGKHGKIPYKDRVCP
jgi:hypothetical protein